ncbi:hypothetical protein [Arsenicicoccus dermatophilus]|uniref:hypothetical protein n=1 Tax=Arsenicicoccus dermatophilus TaxID=1076331 RepID=UPI001F4D3444|nr:hypothetical protein [Arsenicicoccus dermatophilus]MCH8614388.1 hypothetical protein [Arsenicicoccus dermatophilus]
MPQRKSLKDRNRASIAADPTLRATDPAPAPAASRHSMPPATKQPAAPGEDVFVEPEPVRSTRSSTTDTIQTTRIGIYLTPQQFEGAKAAYLVDWQKGGNADTFARWIAQAIETHAARTPEQRATTSQPRGRSAVRTGSSRSFAIPTPIVALMRQAINADHAADRWPSDSAWCAEAIDLATAAARAKNGGTLPTPPPRLPNRLVR